MRVTRLIDRGVENLRTEQSPDPIPGAGEVLIELRAACLNNRDMAVISGGYPVRFPLVPLSDGVGVVAATGAGVTRVQVGDRVSPIYAPEWLSGAPDREMLGRALGGGTDGVLRDKMVAHQNALVKVPAHLSDAQAACLPVAGVTAWSALRAAELSAADTVLVEGTGGVSLFALQLAKVAGARVIVVASGADRASRARSAGADEVVDRSASTDWSKDVLAVTGGQGVDIVIDVGGADSLPKAAQCLRMGGRISAVGFSSGPVVSLPLPALIPKMATLRGILVGSRDTFEELNRIVTQHRLQPVIDRSFPRAQFTDALAYFKGSRQFGKVVLEY